MKLKHYSKLTSGLISLAALLLSLLFLLPQPAQAQIFGPSLPGVECKAGAECKVGAYLVRVTFDRQTFNTTDSFLITVERLDKASVDWQLEAEILPDRRTSATPVKFEGNFDTGDPAKKQVKAYFPISGSWFVHLTLKGSAGKADLRIPAEVEAPPKLNDTLAWLIALAPLVGIVGFAIGQWRYVVKRRRAERLAAQPVVPVQPEEPVQPVTPGNLS